MNHKRNRPKKRRAGDGRLEIEIAPTPMQLKKRGKGMVAVPDAELPELTAQQVRDTLEHVRRRRTASASTGWRIGPLAIKSWWATVSIHRTFF